MSLIIYTLIKLVSSKFGASNHRVHLNYQVNSKDSAENNYVGSAADSWLDKRKLASMSREERVRQLILRHGGRNVSTAIRYLAAELNNHKQQLLAQEGLVSLCACTCHNQDVVVHDCTDEFHTNEPVEGHQIIQRRGSH